MSMKRNGLLLASLTALGIACSAQAAERERVDLGKREYMDKCAVCHGSSGKGDGGAIDILKRTPSDLSTLARRNGGVFPVDRVYGVIDGREAVKGHGSRDMPIWGSRYGSEKAAAGEHYFDMPYDMEMYTRSRILALIDYLNRIQVK